MSAVGRGKK